ncbi:hypothetical protein [Rubrivirga marina]|uniref:LTD domain-containing protein n=1 Tax=Rubrivirga marina TaxID=1196024 RepID=A0A271IYG2_9BACT|nr:hypothetical protein [Rubrivirga marina]PAP76291.1 hypothetical protein BSZ37_07440 [Rubrivirga marina]
MRRLSLLVLAIAGVLHTAGCSDVVDPTVGTNQVFSLYGYLDPAADRQAIRVVPIGQTIDEATPEVLDAVVTTTEAGSGETVTWRDSLVTYRDGSIGHVFVADYTPTPGGRVSVNVAASDGREATVEVEVPPLARSEIGAPFNINALTNYPVTVRGVPRVLGGTLRLYVTGLPTAPADTSTLVVPVDEYTIRQEGADWVVVVPFLLAVQDYLRSANLAGVGLTLIEAEFAAFVTNEAWAVPEGGFDLDAIVEPGAFSNVDGGFGFVGSGYEAPVRWLPSPSTQARAGFAVPGDPASLVAVNEVGEGYAELYNPTLEPINLGGYIVTAGAPEDGVRIQNPTLLDGGAFLVVNGPFAATEAANVALLSSSGRLVSRIFVEEGVEAWGSYPDGLSLPLPQNGPDIFRGPVAPTPGGPNRPAFVPAVINELSAGDEPFVEVLPTYNLFGSARLATLPRDLAFGGSDARAEGRFYVAEENDALVLDPTGGTVYLLVRYGNPKLADVPTGYRVVDARTYGPQPPNRSLGYLPDGPDGAWTEGLLPTRGAPNAAARFGL